MAKSKQSFQKNEKEKKKKQTHKEKEERKALRKTNSNKGKGFDSMIAYVDHNGQLSDTPPDPKLKVEVRAEEILLGARSFIREEVQTQRTGRVAIYNTDRKFGFIKDSVTQERIFFHIADTSGEIREGDTVNYEIVRGPKGLSAARVIKV
jgi:cold shock CspA family protein